MQIGNATMPAAEFIFIELCILVIVLFIRVEWNRPHRQQRRFVRDFVKRTPPEQLFPIEGNPSARIPFSSDIVAEALGIDEYDAARMIYRELTRRKLPRTPSPEVQEKVDQRLRETQVRWERQIREYVDTLPPEKLKDIQVSGEHDKEVAQRFSIPRRISGHLLWEEIYARTKAK